MFSHALDLLCMQGCAVSSDQLLSDCLDYCLSAIMLLLSGRVDTNTLSCWYTQTDPAKTPLVTVVMIKHSYNWFIALFFLSVQRERVRLPFTLPGSDKAYFTGCRQRLGMNVLD